MNSWIKRTGAVAAAVLLLGGLFPLASLAAEEETDWVSEGYTPISTAADLNELVRKDLDGKFFLTGDISFTEADFETEGTYYNDGALWRPLGPTYAERFTGEFEGNGYTISGLQVAVSVGDSDSAYAGLFGYSSGEIRNLSLMNCTIHLTDSTYGYAGGIAGAAGGTIQNCFVLSGNVTVTGAKTAAFAGGVVGRMYAGTLSGCYSSATVRASGATAAAGGIAGQSNATSGIVMNQGGVSVSSSQGDATAGGIIGINGGTLSNALNRGEVSVSAHANAYAGGLAGQNNAALQTSLNSGQVESKGEKTYEGGVAGQCGEEGTLTSCYYLNTTSGAACSDSAQRAIALTAGQLTQRERFSALDFDDVWTMDKTSPFLRAMQSVQNVLTSIRIATKPNRLSFVEGEQLDTSGMVVSAFYEDGTSEPLKASDYTITGYDNTSTGKKTLTVSYRGFSDTLTVTVSQKVMTGIRIQSLPNRVVFGLGEELDLTGGRIAAEYNNGTSVNYDMTADMISGYDNQKLGKQTLTVRYGRDSKGQAFTATFVITMQKEPPPTSATTSAPSFGLISPSGGGIVTGNGTGAGNGGDIAFVTTSPADDSTGGTASLWVVIVLVVVSVLAAGGVVLVELQKQGKLKLHADARHGKSATSKLPWANASAPQQNATQHQDLTAEQNPAPDPTATPETAPESSPDDEEHDSPSQPE